jgi:GntR family transcriptional regulator
VTPMTASAEDITNAIAWQSETPYYQQLSAVLERRLRTGQIPPESRLPSEHALCVEFKLSRATVRQALRYLESRGLVYRVPNRGVFAGSRDVRRGWEIQNTEGFLENAITHQNRSVTTHVLRSGYRPLPDFACEELELPVGTEGFELVRVRHLDGLPTVFSINYLPPAVAEFVAQASDTLSGTASLTGVLQRSGYALAGANRFVRAVTPTQEIADALRIGASDPILQIRSTSWSTDGTRFDVYETYVNTEVVPLEVHVRAINGGSG